MIVVVMYAKYAPFHKARLEATGLMGKRIGHRTVGIEIAGSQADYQWPLHLGPAQHYEHVTLFPGRERWELGRAELRTKISAALDTIRPDVAVLPGWGIRDSLAGLGCCLRKGVPRVLLTDSQEIDVPQNWLKTRLKRALVAQFQAALAGGKPHVRYLEELGFPAERCLVGCDVVDNDALARESEKHRSQREGREPTLLSCLRFLPRKNIVGVLKTLADRAPGWHWRIAGDGPQRPRIEWAIRRYHLEDRVHLLGHVEYGDLPRVYAEADVYLQPSLSEPWGLAVNEAMACGLPVLVSDRCGCREDLVQDGANGYVFDPARPDALASALARLMQSRSKWREMGEASRATISRWGPDLYAENLWRACSMAMRSEWNGPAARAAGRVLSRVL